VSHGSAVKFVPFFLIQNLSFIGLVFGTRDPPGKPDSRHPVSIPSKTIQNHPTPMKLPIQWFAAGSAAALLVCPAAMAGQGRIAAPEKVEIDQPTDAEELIMIDDEVIEIIDDGEVVDGGEGEVTITMIECEVEPGEGRCGTGEDGGVCEGEVPIDWVKRDGVNEEDLIFHTMVDAENMPITTTAGQGSPELGEDDRASRLEEAAGNPLPLIKREKKGPVALVNKGRVFLR
jgi:hypothetical protein